MIDRAEILRHEAEQASGLSSLPDCGHCGHERPMYTWHGRIEGQPEASRFTVYNHGDRGQIEIGTETHIPLCRGCHAALLCSDCRDLDATTKPRPHDRNLCDRCWCAIEPIDWHAPIVLVPPAGTTPPHFEVTP